ncbi:MAG: AAA family ATPase [Cyclobacteriaceae bacterium]
MKTSLSTKQTIIGICGISQSGKSTLARGLKKELTAKGIDVKVFEIDHYTVEKDQIPSVRDRLDWEHPDSIDWDRLVRQIEKASAQVVIIEGIFVFHSRLLPFYSKTILVEQEKEIFYERRTKEIRWGDEPMWYLDHVWDTNQKLVSLATPDLRLKPGDPNKLEASLKLVEACLK